MTDASVKHLEKAQLEKIRQICDRYRVDKLYIFGSALTDGYRPDRDIDLQVRFEDINLLEYADNYFDFLAELQETLKRPVDLVIEKDLSNPVLIESINEHKVLIYDPK